MAVVAKQTHNNGKPKGKIVAIYDYKDADGKLLYQVCRYEPKRFQHRQPDGNDGWIYQGSDRRVVYRWPDLIAYPDATVFLCEGEKDTDNVRALELIATTVASGKWTQDCIDPLTGRDCWVIQDVDINGAGDKKARNTANRLHGVAKSIKIVRLPGLTGNPGNKDVSDWLEQGHSKDELIEVCASTPDWAPDDASASDSDAQDEAAAERGIDLIKSSREFVAGFVPPDYLVDGMLQEAFLYSNTGATHERLKDSKGRLIPTVVCDWISDSAKEDIAKQKVTDEDRLLTLIDADPKASTATLATKMEWKLYNGEPNKMKVGRALKTMIKHKLIKETRAGNYRLTDEGKAAMRGEK
jgi:hypothetical protein